MMQEAPKIDSRSGEEVFRHVAQELKQRLSVDADGGDAERPRHPEQTRQKRHDNPEDRQHRRMAADAGQAGDDGLLAHPGFGVQALNEAQQRLATDWIVRAVRHALLQLQVPLQEEDEFLFACRAFNSGWDGELPPSLRG